MWLFWVLGNACPLSSLLAMGEVWWRGPIYTQCSVWTVKHVNCSHTPMTQAPPTLQSSSYWGHLGLSWSTRAPSRGGSIESFDLFTVWQTREERHYSPFGPSFLSTCMAVLPLSLFSTDTTVSAGWDTMAQNTPAAGHGRSQRGQRWITLLLNRGWIHLPNILTYIPQLKLK